MRNGLLRASPWLALLALAGFFAATVPFTPLGDPCARSEVTETPDGGLRFAGRSLVVAGADGLHDEPFRWGRFTIELDAAAAGDQAYGPARILAHSFHAASQNWIVGQYFGDLYVRHRRRQAVFPGAVPVGARAHLVFVLDGPRVTLYRDGGAGTTVEFARRAQPWEDRAVLVLGNALTGDRPWPGTVHEARLFARPLPPAEARALAGGGGPPADVTVLPGGDWRVEAWPWRHKWAQFLAGERSHARDMVLNLFGTLPLGLLFGLWWRRLRAGRALLLVGGVQFLASALAEGMQFVAYERAADVTDVVTNVAGALAGVLVARFYLASTQPASSPPSRASPDRSSATP